MPSGKGASAPAKGHVGSHRARSSDSLGSYNLGSYSLGSNSARTDAGDECRPGRT